MQQIHRLHIMHRQWDKVQLQLVPDIESLLKRRRPEASRVVESWWVTAKLSSFIFISHNLILGCDKSQISDVKMCSMISENTSSSPSLSSSVSPTNDQNAHKAAEHTQLKPEKSSAGFVTAICSVFAIVFIAVCWVFYAYTHPHTGSGQFLIQYGRPAAWSWRRGEARYTAATIHMWKWFPLNQFPQFCSSNFSVLFFVLMLSISIDVMTQCDFNRWIFNLLSLSSDHDAILTFPYCWFAFSWHMCHYQLTFIRCFFDIFFAQWYIL